MQFKNKLKQTKHHLNKHFRIVKMKKLILFYTSLKIK